MRILIIVGSFKFGGAERMSLNIGEELKQRGHDVHFVLQRPIFEIPNTIEQNKIHVLRKKNSQSFFYKSTSLVFGIYRVSKKIRPDVTIAFSRFSSFLANFTLNKNIVARFDTYPYRLTKKQQIWADIIIASPLVKHIIVPSTDMLEALAQHKPQGINKFYRLPNTLSAEVIIDKSNLEHSFNIDSPYIVAMGRLTWQKNFELLIESYRRSKIKDKYSLVIIGDGPRASQLKQLINKYDLGGKIILTGRLDNPFPIIKNARFFVNTSKFEGFPNVILEAPALGKPIIATNCNFGPVDMIIPEYNGILILDNDRGALLTTLDHWCEDENIIDKYAAHAKQSVQKYSIEQVATNWENLLFDLYN